MTDRLHDHMTLGFRRGCVACAQVEADMSLSARAYSEKFLTITNSNPAHPRVGSGLVRISASA